MSGVTEPVVTAPNGQALAGRVVLFDPERDLALIAVRGLDADPLRVAATPSAGDAGVVAGYPYGGPFTEGGARVQQVGRVSVPDVQGSGRSVRSIAALAADVEPGNSGGPLLTSDGLVSGVVFAKSTSEKDLGYAMTRAEFGGVVDRAASLSGAVSTGTCSAD